MGVLSVVTAINRWRWSVTIDDDEAKEAITAQVAAELAERIDEK